MAASTHIIKAQEYQIGLSDQREAHQVQTNISGLQETRINTLLNEVLNKFEDKDFIYQFNTIELDLGSMRKSNYENELVYRLEEELTKYLSYNILENGRLREGHRIETYERLLDNLEYFLENGHFKWNSTHGLTPMKLWSNLLTTQPQELLQLLKKLGKQEAIRKRMIFQFQEETLEEIVSLATKEEGRYMISYKNKILDYQEKRRIIESPAQAVHAVIWEIILGYIFAEGKSYYDKKSFLQYLIRKMATSYNIAYQSLLNILNEVLQKDVHIAGHHSQFKKLVIELSTEEISLIPAETATASHEKAGLSQWLDEVLHYLKFGGFNPQFPVRSREDFNDQFRKILKSGERLVLVHLNAWLRDESKKKKILAIASPRTLNQIVTITDIPSIKVAVEFIDALKAKKEQLSNNAKLFLEQLQISKGELILTLPVSENFQEKKLLHHLLRNILNISNRQEDDLIQFLMETKPLLCKKHEKIVAKFLMTFYQNMGKIVLQSIATEIKDYLHKTPPEFWDMWLEDKIPQWTRGTRLSRATLLQYVVKNFRKNREAEQLRLFIEVRKSHKFSSVKTDLGPSPSTTDQPSMTENALVKNRENAILYLLEKGQLPWWIEGEAFWSHFDTDFSTMWASAKNKGLILRLVKKNAKKASYTRLLNTENFLLLLRELETNPNNENTTLVNDVYRFIIHTLMPLGGITVSEHLEFKETILNIFLDSPANELSRNLLQFIKKWYHSSKIKSQVSLSETFESFLKEIALKIPGGALKADFELWVDTISLENFQRRPKEGHPSSLKDFLGQSYPVSKDLRSKAGMARHLQGLLSTQPKQFDALLKDAIFRAGLLSELQKTDLVAILEQKMSSNQRETYRQALLHLDRYKPYISNTEHKAMHETFTRLLLLKLSSDGIRAWGINDWSRFIFHTFNQAIGTQKNKNITFRIKEKLSLENGSVRLLNQSFIAQLNELADETSEKVLEETKEIFSAFIKETDTKIVAKKLTLKDQKESIHKKLNAIQFESYREVAQHLQRFGSYVSKKEYDDLWRLFSDLVLVAADTGRLTSWGLQDWTQLLFGSTQKVIGKKKHTAIFFSIKEKLNIPSEETDEESKKLLEIWEDLLLETSEKKVADSENIFQSLHQAFTTETQASKPQDALILQKISANQKKFYEQAVSHLNSYKPYVSNKEYSDMRHLASKFLLSKLNAEGISSWGMKDWGHLLFHSMNQVLGETKNKEIRFRIKEKLNIDTEIEINESQQFINQLSTLASEVPENVIMENQASNEDHDYKKLGEKGEREFLDPIFVVNAGLIILAPYLGLLFEKCGLMEGHKFIDDASQFKGVQLLAYAAMGKTSQEENELTIQKVLCGLDLTTPLAKATKLSASDMETVDGLLKAVTQQWRPLNASTIDSLRASFLQRDGKLEEEAEQFYLKVEQKPYDMLLAQIPWNISKIKLSFMKKVIEVEWKT